MRKRIHKPKVKVFHKRNTYENWIVKQIKSIEKKLATISKDRTNNDLTEHDYDVLFHRYSSQKDILYMILTGHDNNYGKKKKK